MHIDASGGRGIADNDLQQGSIPWVCTMERLGIGDPSALLRRHGRQRPLRVRIPLSPRR